MLDKRDWYANNVRTQDQVMALVTGSQDKGIHYIQEGTHEFTLKSGARLKVYASEWTPVYGDWAFQYDRGKHGFDIPSDVHIAITHGPPRGILDLAWDESRAGCPNLFSAVQKSKPLVHCYGHIHEAWGAYLGVWNQTPQFSDTNPCTYLSALDQEKSWTVEDIQGIKLEFKDKEDDKEEKMQRYRKYAEDGCIKLDIDGNSKAGGLGMEKDRETLFVNAAVLDARYKMTNFPWMVEVGLPRA